MRDVASSPIRQIFASTGVWWIASLVTTLATVWLGIRGIAWLYLVVVGLLAIIAIVGALWIGFRKRTGTGPHRGRGAA